MAALERRVDEIERNWEAERAEAERLEREQDELWAGTAASAR